MRSIIVIASVLALTSPSFAAEEATAPAAGEEIATPVASEVMPPPIAVEESATAATPSAPTWEISLKAGGHFPQIANKLGTNFDAILKVGYGVALERRLQIFADFAYSQPARTSSGTDMRLGASGAEYTSTITVRDLTTTLGAEYLIPVDSHLWLPYAGVGLQLHFLKSDVKGNAAGTSFGDTSETSTQVGGVVFGGTGIRLGPGLILGELRFGFATVSQKVTGSANVGALSVLLGYGLLL